jgi:hypothetical protein
VNSAHVTIIHQMISATILSRCNKSSSYLTLLRMAQMHAAHIEITVEEQRIGEELLQDIRSVSSLNAFLFNHLRHILLPPGTSRPLPLHTKINTSKPMKDGRALELYIGILFHCMGYRVLECGGGPGDGGVDVMVEGPEGRIIVQCKQHSRTVIGSEIGHQLIGTMYMNDCKMGILVSSTKVSRDIKMVARVLETVRDGEMKMLIWEGDTLVKLFGRYSQAVLEKRTQMLANASAHASLRQYLDASQQQPFCITHGLSSPDQCLCSSNAVSPVVLPRPIAASVPVLPSTSMPCVVLLAPAVVPSRSTAASVPVLPPVPLLPVALPRPTVVPLLMCGAHAESDDELELLSDSDDESSPLPPGSVLVNISSSPRINVLPGSSPAGVGCKIVWTAEEEEELRSGVEQWGAGSWSDILAESSLMRSRGKTNIKLRDKWRNMQRKDFRAMTPRKPSAVATDNGLYAPISVRF